MCVEYAEDVSLRNSRYRKLLLGVCVLLLVNVIWVASSELTEYIFIHKNFDKPFFTTYSKTVLFSLYLIGFTFFKPWQYQCGLHWQKDKNVRKAEKGFKREVNNALADDKELTDSSSINPSLVSIDTSSSFSSRASSPPHDRALSEPIFEQMTDDDISTTGSEDIGGGGQRRVKFSRVREVRRMAGEQADAALLARMSRSSITDLQSLLDQMHRRIPLPEVVKLALYFCFPWVLGNFFYQQALSKTSPAVTNILSSSSGLFTLILSAVFQSSALDKFTLSKLLAVIMSVSGIVCVSLSDPSAQHTSINYGAMFSLFGALGCKHVAISFDPKQEINDFGNTLRYSIYLVLLTKKVGSEKTLDIPLFFGFVGVFGGLLFWPVFFVLHLSGIERFSLPPDTNTWLFLLVNGIVGTVLSELLWLWGCFLTSSLIGTLALSLIIPLTMAWDMTVNKIQFSWLFFGGTIPVFLSFFAVSVLGHYQDWDPVMNLLERVHKKIREKWQKRRGSINEPEQRERLISVEANISEDATDSDQK